MNVWMRLSGSGLSKAGIQRRDFKPQTWAPRADCRMTFELPSKQDVPPPVREHQTPCRCASFADSLKAVPVC